MSGPHPDPMEELAPHKLDGKLEPELKDSADERAPLYSIAISLKRIADVMETASADAARQGGLSNVLWTLGNSFGDGISRAFPR